MKSRMIVAAFLAVLAVSCAGISKKGIPPTKQVIGETAVTVYGIDIMTARDMAIFAILDPGFGDTLKTAPNYDELRTLIDTRKDSMISSGGLNWRDVGERLAYFKSVGGNDSSLYLPPGERDIRLDAFLKNGKPSGWWILPGEWVLWVAGDNFHLVGNVMYHIFRWPNGKVAMFHSDTSSSIPVREAVPVRRIPERNLVIYPESQVSTLYDDKGEGHVIASCWVRADQLNQASFDTDSLEFRIEIKDAKDHIVFEDKHTVSLAVYEPIAKIAWNLRGFPIMSYFEAPKLRPGDYTAKIKVIGGSSNAGRETVEFKVSKPTPVIVSEPVFLLDSSRVPQGDLVSGIFLGGERLYIRPSLTFARGSTVPAIAWIKVLESGAYRIKCGLVPFGESKLAGITSLTSSSDVSASSVAYEACRHIESLAKVETRVTFNVPNGRYFFWVGVTDPEETQWLSKPSWVIIEVRESVL